MTQLQIESFCTLANTLNFSKAAELLYVTQPVLSRRISALEAELKFRLFDRDTHSVRLTEPGQIMYDYFVRQKKTYAQYYERALNCVAGSRVFKVGLLDNLDSMGVDVVDVINGVQEKFPHVRISLYQQAFPYSFTSLTESDFDVIMAMDDQFELTAELEFRPLIDCQVQLYYSAANGPENAEEVGIRSFAHSDFFIADSQDSRLGAAWLRKLLENFFPNEMPRIISLTQMSAILSNAACGLGVAIADEPATKSLPSHLMKDIRACDIAVHKLGLLYKKSGDAMLKEFCDSFCLQVKTAGLPRRKALPD